MPLNQMIFPEPASTLFESLINIVTFDFLGQLEELGYGLEYDVSPTTAYNDGFETLGYGSAEPIDLLGSINFILAIVLLQGLRYLYPNKCCFSSSLKKSGKCDKWTNGFIRFTIEIFFEFMICVGAVFCTRTVRYDELGNEEQSMRLIDYNKQEMLDLDVFGIWYTSAIALFSLAFLIFSCIVVLCCNRKIVNKERKARNDSKYIKIVRSEAAQKVIKSLKQPDDTK